MSHLPGNPYPEDASNFAVEASQRQAWPSAERVILAQQATTYATLALAYEQRLTTLALLFSAPDDAGVVTNLNYTEAARQLCEGLGMRAGE
ncbi:hypothetical protein [Glutamicibacter ardleyensis]|uniref:AMP-dependent synthetase/ligase domain-containing protein n=1 Tax=Glutamicibacter ardleyensis TaxID=225894 RepID=A0ABQ2DJT0_9MICC|nr:hypothetical protein [Glutamicibacter ardleyensis]GGJ56059.1 hypothetical protein GCM10007173_13590 [Glutamicibacter ardleyensis]